jgi:tetratricopeptide (TPR) repeat protein
MMPVEARRGHAAKQIPEVMNPSPFAPSLFLTTNPNPTLSLNPTLTPTPTLTLNLTLNLECGGSTPRCPGRRLDAGPCSEPLRLDSTPSPTPTLPLPLPLTLFLTLFLTLATACGGDPVRAAFDRDLVAFETAVAQGRYLEAEALGEPLLERAASPLQRCPVLFERARVSAALGRSAEALDRMAQVGRECAGDPLTSSRALLSTARIVRGSSRDPMDSVPVYESVIRNFPGEPFAREAVTEIGALVSEAQGRAAAAARLLELAAEVDGSAAQANLLFEAAGLLARMPEVQGQVVQGQVVQGPVLQGQAVQGQVVQGQVDPRVAAMETYREVARKHPGHGLANDALWLASGLALELDRPGEAVRDLMALLGRRESSYLIGSYEVAFYPKAAFRLAEAESRATSNPAKAKEWYRYVIRHFPRSPEAAAARERFK